MGVHVGPEYAIQLEHIHTVAMIFLFFGIGLIALKVQLSIQKSKKKDIRSSSQVQKRD